MVGGVESRKAGRHIANRKTESGSSRLAALLDRVQRVDPVADGVAAERQHLFDGHWW